jgi:hypothetical protein
MTGRIPPPAGSQSIIPRTGFTTPMEIETQTYIARVIVRRGYCEATSNLPLTFDPQRGWR